MIVAELIHILWSMPKSAKIRTLWDGKCRTSVDAVWLSKSGVVVLTGSDDVVYDDDDRPIYAPSETDEPYWTFATTPPPNLPHSKISRK